VEAVGAVDDEPSVVDTESHGSEDPRMAPPPFAHVIETPYAPGGRFAAPIVTLSTTRGALI
jgi:hypothetical protein